MTMSDLNINWDEVIKKEALDWWLRPWRNSRSRSRSRDYEERNSR